MSRKIAKANGIAAGIPFASPQAPLQGERGLKTK